MPSVRTFLGATRALVGITSWVAPDRAARTFGIDPAHADRFVTRLFGSREVALAASLLAAPAGAVAPAAALGVAIDALDVVSGVQELRRGTLSTTGAVLGAGGAALFVVLGAVVLREAAPAADA